MTTKYRSDPGPDDSVAVLRRDRDYWKQKAKLYKFRHDQMEVELANMRRKHVEEIRRLVERRVFA